MTEQGSLFPHLGSDALRPANPHRRGTVRWWALEALYTLPNPVAIEDVVHFIRERSPEVGARSRLPNQVWAALDRAPQAVRVDRGLFVRRSLHEGAE